MQVSCTAAGGDFNALERQGEIDAASQRNHEFVIASLDHSEVRSFSILIMGGSKGCLETGVCLEEPIESPPIAHRHYRGCAEIVGCAANRDCGSQSDDYIVAVEAFLSKKHAGDQHATEKKTKSAFHALSLRRVL